MATMFCWIKKDYFVSVEDFKGVVEMKTETGIMPIDELIESVKLYNPNCDEALIRDAFALADKLHEGQKRDSGEPYIMHPLAVASILSSLHMDDSTIIAGLLHDVVEDTDMTLEQMAERYGETMALLLDGVTKLEKIKFRSKKEHQVENLRKMFLAMSKDIRIIIIKLADRLHNMRTLSTHRSEIRKKEIALETQEIFAPLAHRLGIYKIKWELEDLSLRYLEPEAYENLVMQINMKRDEREAYLSSFCGIITENLEKSCIKSDISGRPKNFYSIYRKMIKQNKDLNQIYDIHAVRVLVDSLQDCYGALGIVHSLWTPMPGRFKDYIAMPKANMYQSLHTTVIGPNAQPVEVQIRTYEMHYISEYGIAAHWKYKEGATMNANSAPVNEADNRLKWMRQMLDWQKEVSDAKEFVDNVKDDFFADTSIFVFTPTSDVVELPAGSNPIDFAYRVHTQVGHQCVGAKVAGRMVTLDTVLQNGDIVEILTTRGSGPSRDWLKIVKTNQAKNKIRQWFRKEGRDEFAVQKGRDILEKESAKAKIDAVALFKVDMLTSVAKKAGFVSGDDLFVALAEGGITAINVVNRIREDLVLKKALMPEEEVIVPQKQPKIQPFKDSNFSLDKGVWVKGEAGLMVTIANCCKPLPGDDINGYITRGRGVSVHRADCANILNYEKTEPHRLVDVRWDGGTRGVFQAEIVVEGQDRAGIAASIMSAIAETKTTINFMNFEVDNDKVFHGTLRFEIQNLGQLEYLINKIKRVKGITEVKRNVKEK